MNKELKEYLKKVDGVSHITFDPYGPGVARIHLIPPKNAKVGVAWLTIINGENILPLTTGWAILFREFINAVTKYAGKSLKDEDIEECILEAVSSTSKIFPKAKKEMLKDDLKEIIEVLIKIARHEKVSAHIGYESLKDYAKYMAAPHRMDLMLSAMEKDGHWNCNQKCLNCYAAGESLSNVKELNTDEWKSIIDKLRKACIPQITFTGGEPTLRSDLVELIDYSSWFVTRLNTNGLLLTKELCSDLYKASLDAVQITFYSDKPEIHNLLVGAQAFEKCVEGIKNALEAKLVVSLNTPLCNLNKDYVSLIKFASNLGIRYFTCSGLIETGNAKENGNITLTEDELFNILKEAKGYANEHDLEIKFTTPGVLSKTRLKELGLDIPSCGACLSNMAVSPNGELIACQSSLSESFGSILDKSFSSLWNSKECKNIRNRTIKSIEKCPLNERNKIK